MAMSLEQQSLLQLMKEADRIMRDNHIRYYMFGGSIIGALRHNGFIPWDYDIDIFMDRDNFYRLVEVAKQSSWDGIEFVSFETNTDYFRAFGQFSTRKDTYFLKTRMFNQGICLGTTIDVFVMDYVPTAKLEEHFHNALLYQEVLSDAYTYYKPVYKLKEEYRALKEEEKRIGKEAVIGQLKEKLEQYTEEESENLVVRLWGIKMRIYNKKMLGEPRYYPFEDMQVPVPARAEACLRYQYGYDWYRVPARQEWLAHDYYANFNMSYNNYSDDFGQFMDWDRAFEQLKERKLYDIEREANRAVLDEYRQNLLAARILMQSDIEQNEQKALAAYHHGQYQTFLEYMSELTNNIKVFLKAEHVEAGLSSELIGAWIEALVYSGQYYTAIKVKNAFARDLEQLPAVRMLEALLPMVEAYQDHDHAAMKKHLDKLEQKKRIRIPDCILADAVLCLEQGVPARYDEMLHVCDVYLKHFPENYEVMKIKADLLSASGKDAMALYRTVYEHTRNGLDLLELEQKYHFRRKESADFC